MTSGMVTSGRSPTASARPVGWNEVLRPFGLSIKSELEYDLQSNQIVPLRSEFGQVVTPYPLWLRAISTRSSVVNEQSGEVFLPWTSSVDTTGAPPGTVTPLLVTSRAAGSATGTTSLDPRGTFPQYDLHTRLLAAMAAPAAGDSSQPRHGRVIVVGNSGFASDHYASMAPDNLVFALNAVDWLAQDEALIAIRSRDRRPPQLMFTSPMAATIVEYGNVVGLPVLVALLGLIRLVGRRRASRLPYRRTGEGPDVAAAGIREEAA